MQHLYFARHGLSELNVRGRFAGKTNTPLTDEGREQARQAGISAKGLQIDTIVCSPLSRAHETAKIIAKEIDFPENKIHVNSLFVERDFGSLEGTPWSPDLDMDGMVDVESSDAVIERARLGLQFITSLQAKNVLVVSHGSFGRALRLNVTKEFTWDHPTRLQNAEIVKWEFDQ